MLGDQGRRRQELGMSEELSWSSVSDDDLKQIMSEIQTLTPGIGGGSDITGSSVHNQRVKRLHRLVTSGVLHGYIEQFQQLERYGLLDSSNDVHLFALHFVHKERINRSLQEFIAHWNHRSLSTENNLSPLQLWIVPGCSSTVLILLFSSTWHPDR